MKSYLSLRECLGLSKIDRNYYDTASDTLSAAGLPSIGSVYGNLNVPTLSDVGGSAKDYAGTLNQGVNNAFGQYLDYAKSLPTANDVYGSLEKSQGIPQLRATQAGLLGSVNDLSNQITRVEPNVNANTTNSLVTEGQRAGMVTAQKYPLEQALAPMSTALGNIGTQITQSQQGINDQVAANTATNQQLLGVAGMGVTVAQDNAARSMTGFTSDEQNNMNLLLKKLDIQKSLDDAEWSTLSMLAGKKIDYQNALGQITEQSKYLNVPQGGSIVNAQTGGITRSSTPITPSISTGNASSGGSGSTLTPQQQSTLDSIFGSPAQNAYPALNLNFGQSGNSGSSAMLK